MRTVSEWKATLRARMREALVAKNKPALAVLRQTLAAIDNAEAPVAETTSATMQDAAFAGSVGGLGAGEVARLSLSPEAVAAIIEREIRDLHNAAAEYRALGRHDEADVLAGQSDVLVDLTRSARPQGDKR